MKNRKILFTVVSILMICVCLISSNVYAVQREATRSFRLTLRAGKTVVNPGDQVRIQMEVSNLRNV